MLLKSAVLLILLGCMQFSLSLAKRLDFHRLIKGPRYILRTLIIQYQISRAFTSFFPLKGYKVNEKWDDDYSEDITTSDDNNVNGDNDASGGRMQIMITNRMRKSLADGLKYLPSEIDAMELQIAKGMPDS